MTSELHRYILNKISGKSRQLDILYYLFIIYIEKVIYIIFGR